MKFSHLHTLAAAALLAAAAPAFSHGDEAHSKARTYDPAKVEDTAFGREGDPKKVTAPSGSTCPTRCASRRPT